MCVCVYVCVCFISILFLCFFFVQQHAVDCKTHRYSSLGVNWSTPRRRLSQAWNSWSGSYHSCSRHNTISQHHSHSLSMTQLTKHRRGSFSINFSLMKQCLSGLCYALFTNCHNAFSVLTIFYKTWQCYTFFLLKSQCKKNCCLLMASDPFYHNI